jgi:hypothetical protein
MKKVNWVVMIAAMLFTGMISSCNGDAEDEVPVTPANVLCDGNGSSSNYPFAMDNRWVYSGTVTQTYTVTEVATVGGNQQYTVEARGLNDWTDVYTVGSNGDVFFKSAGVLTNDTNYLHVPANPTLNQEWLYTISFDGHITRRVTSLTASVTTSNCDYTDCIEIKSYDGTGDYLYAHYYKQGLGLVKKDNSLFADNNLNSVTLN